ncbi:hypothetical protein GOP47_0020565 [Adiantum capillus-veneris]|uniref:Uncharacterized protein n=1 Tax=Adiantum capillus-veneris TaxID=13818 RepID=A0A9D4Z7K2_ADICA|nr:hypothetical protein GOP47_0020565 [Adiantum capillus-veneris]
MSDQVYEGCGGGALRFDLRGVRWGSLAIFTLQSWKEETELGARLTVLLGFAFDRDPSTATFDHDPCTLLTVLT